jgi:hypothetical protein
MKDWTGSNASIFKQLGASNHTEEYRELNDFYATEPSAIDDLIKVETLNKNIWECAVGEGHLANRLQELQYTVYGSDIVNRGWNGTEIIDFMNFKPQKQYDIDIVTNPPYKYCSEFILKALECVKSGRKVCMFLKLSTLEGQKRYEEIYSKYPPKAVYVYSKRKECAKNGNFIGSSAVCYAWFVWEKDNYKSKTIIDWI